MGEHETVQRKECFDRREYFFALAVAALLLVAIYAPALWQQGEAFLWGRSDLWGYFGPAAHFLDTSLAQGVWPLWNPHVLCGTPFTANPQAAVFYPPHLLRGVLHVLVERAPSPEGTLLSLAVMTVAHQLLLAVGMYRFARGAGLCRLSSTVALLAYLGGAEVVFRSVQHWAFVAVAAWLPWLLLCARGGLRDWRAACLCGVVFGLMLLIGFPQLMLYAGVFLAGYLLASAMSGAKEVRTTEPFQGTGGEGAVTQGSSLRAQPWTTGTERRWRSGAGVDGVGAGVGGAGAEFVGTGEGVGGVGGRVGSGSSSAVYMRLLRAVGVLAVIGGVGVALALPMLLPAEEFAAHAPRAKEIGAGSDIADPRLGGYSAFASLLQMAVLYPGSHGVRLLGVVAGLLALCALRTRRLAQAMGWLLLFVVMLDACFGPPWPVATVLARIAPFRIAEPQRAALFAAFALAMLAAHGLDALARPRASVLSDHFWGRAMTLVSGGLLLALVEWERLDPVYPVWAGVLVVQVVGMVAVVAALGMPRLRPRAVQVVALAMVAELAIWGSAHAAKLAADDSFPARWGDYTAGTDAALSNTRRVGAAWLENDAMYRGDFAVTGYDPLMIGAARQALCAPRTEPLYNRRISAQEVEQENALGTSLFSRRFWLCSAPPLGKLPPKGVPFFPAEPAENDRQLRIVASDANSVMLQTQATSAPTWIVVTTPAYPGWRVRVDGEERPLLTAYGLLQAVALSAGTHTVQFEFRSTRVVLGVALAVLTLIALAVVAAWRSILTPKSRAPHCRARR